MTYEIKYRKEEEMKDSGIEWLGKVPKDWKICKIKDISLLKTGDSISATDKDSKYSNLLLQYYPYIGTKDIDISTNIIEYDNELYIPKKTQFKVAKENTVLICIEGGSAGRKIGYLNRKSCYGNKLCNIEGNNKIINKLLYYILQSDHFVLEFFNKMTGIIPGVSIEDFKNINSILPNSKDQQKIANFLDLKTSEFDSIISKKEKLIAKLEEAKKSLISEVVTGKVKIVDGDIVERKAEEMKDSGIEWLGMIPKDWEDSKIKFELDFYNHRRIPLSSEERGKLKNKAYDYYGASGIIDKVDSYLFEGEYILIGEDGANLYSRSTDLAFLAKGRFWVNNHAHILKSKNGLDDYYVILLESIDYHNYITGSAQPKLTKENLGGIKIPLVSDKEQIDIMIYLNSKSNELKSIINKNVQIIQKIKLAKQSLISEAVTGKIDLSDWEII